MDLESQKIRASNDRERWNRKYLARGPEAFGVSPTAWLRDHDFLIERQQRGHALDVACGNGRNACYLARHGFTVDALDISDVAIAWLQKEVERTNLSVHPKCCDLGNEPLKSDAYEVILNFNFLDRQLFPLLKRALRPRGLLFIQTFLSDDSSYRGHPMRAAFTLESGELRDAFEDLEIVDYRESRPPNKDPENARAVASLVARMA